LASTRAKNPALFSDPADAGRSRIPAPFKGAIPRVSLIRIRLNTVLFLGRN
jgi:hypothetical protein